jgi:hypothetical protein
MLMWVRVVSSCILHRHVQWNLLCAFCLQFHTVSLSASRKPCYNLPAGDNRGWRILDVRMIV